MKMLVYLQAGIYLFAYFIPACNELLICCLKPPVLDALFLRLIALTALASYRAAAGCRLRSLVACQSVALLFSQLGYVCVGVTTTQLIGLHSGHCVKVHIREIVRIKGPVFRVMVFNISRSSWMKKDSSS